MKISIQMKFLAMCILLVLLTTAGISATYYVLTKQDKQRESRQRIQIAFDIILDDFADRLNTYRERFDEFLQEDDTLREVTYSYSQDTSRIGSMSFIFSYFIQAADELKSFGHVVSANCLSLYGADKRLLAMYQRHDEQDTVGAYVVSQTGNNTYLALDDPSQLSQIRFSKKPLPEVPLPSGVTPHYEGDIPDAVSVDLFIEEQKLGIRIMAPIYHLGSNNNIGVLIGEVFYAQSSVERYASLSKTAVNLFAGDQLSVGTLRAQTHLAPDVMEQIASCEDILNQDGEIDVSSVTLDNQDYYQGRCAFKNAQGTIGAISISLSQDIEKQAIRKILTAVLMISGIAIVVAFGLSLLFSRNAIRSIQNIVNVIGTAAEGDLRKTAVAPTRDEFGMLAMKLNQMIARLRTISSQIQEAAHSVNSTADTIFQEMNTLTRRMEQQSGSVDNATGSIEKINQFINVIRNNTTELLAAAEQILSSTHEMNASREEVTASTGHLATNAQLISSSVDQVNHAIKHISENTKQLVKVAQQTETEIHHIDQALEDVSHNANRFQQFAKETMNAAQSGQMAVGASIQGMTELKEAVSHSAQIIQKINSWGEQVSSILDIVDDITEQTSLLALNASIISAQAGEHGRGFAVVANEIKDLATRTKASTNEIASLIHTLQANTEEGVQSIAEGIAKADQGVQLASGVKEALHTILESATRSATMATDTAQVIQQTTASSQIIRTSMNGVTEMVSQIRTAIQEQEQDISQVVSAIENIREMSEQVNRASIEQNTASGQIAESLELVIEKLSDISTQTEELTRNSNQIVTAMHTIESITENILVDTTGISGHTANNLVQQAEVLQQIVNVFKVS